MLPGSGEKPEIPEMEEPIGASPPLELRRPASGPRTTVPHCLQSPQDRATGKLFNFNLFDSHHINYFLNFLFRFTTSGTSLCS